MFIPKKKKIKLLIESEINTATQNFYLLSFEEIMISPDINKNYRRALVNNRSYTLLIDIFIYRYLSIFYTILVYLADCPCQEIYFL